MKKFGVIVLVLFIFFPLFQTNAAFAQRKRAKVVAVVDGDSVYQVLPPDAIPAIRKPVYVTGKEASAQMSAKEPVMGLLYKGESRAYSLWQLDAHEIVNDVIGGVPLAVTW